MSKVVDWKVEVLTKVFAEFAGLTKVLAVNVLSTFGIGQLVLISKVVTDTKAPADLLTLIKGINTGSELDEIGKGIKGKGFVQAESLINFSTQLKAEKVLMLEALLADKEGIKLLKIGSDALLADYLYIR